MGELQKENSGQLPESAGPASAKPSGNSVRSSRFKYYIHDSVDTCRLQLLGEFTESDTAELSGCWGTAKTTLGKRKLVLDLRGLRAADQAGKEWLASMQAEGAVYLPDSYLRTGVSWQPVSRREPQKPGLFGKLLSLFRGTRVVATESSTQAQ